MKSEIPTKKVGGNSYRTTGRHSQHPVILAGRARWSGAHAHASRASYSSYTSDFQGYGYGSYAYETRSGFQMDHEQHMAMGNLSMG